MFSFYVAVSFIKMVVKIIFFWNHIAPVAEESIYSYVIDIVSEWKFTKKPLYFGGIS